MLLNGEEGVGPGDRYIAASLAHASGPVTVAVNKVDRLSRSARRRRCWTPRRSPGAAEVFPISARSGEGVAALVERLVATASRRPLPLRAEQRRHGSEELLAELIREQVLRRTFQEFRTRSGSRSRRWTPMSKTPHFGRPPSRAAGGRVTRIRRRVWVETESKRGSSLVAAGHGQGDRRGGPPRAEARAGSPGPPRAAVGARSPGAPATGGCLSRAAAAADRVGRSHLRWGESDDRDLFDSAAWCRAWSRTWPAARC